MVDWGLDVDHVAVPLLARQLGSPPPRAALLPAQLMRNLPWVKRLPLQRDIKYKM